MRKLYLLYFVPLLKPSDPILGSQEQELVTDGTVKPSSVEFLLANSHLVCSNLQITNVMGKVPMSLHPSPAYDHECCSSMRNCSYYHTPYMYGPTYSMPHFHHQPSHQRLQGNLGAHAALAFPHHCVPYTKRVYFPPYRINSGLLLGRAQIPHPSLPQTIMQSYNTQVCPSI